MCMPDNLRLDMAIKYSSEAYIDSLEEVRIVYFTLPKLSFHLVVNRSKVTAVIQYVRRSTPIQRTKAKVDLDYIISSRMTLPRHLQPTGNWA